MLSLGSGICSHELTFAGYDNFKEILSLEDLNRKRTYRKIRPGDSDDNIGLERITNEAGTKEQFLILKGVDVGEYANIDESLLNDDEYNEYESKMELFENTYVNNIV